MKTIEELRKEAETAEQEASEAGQALREAEERAELEARIRNAQARASAAKIAVYWQRWQPIAEAKRWRLGRMALGSGDSYAEVFFRHASEEEIRNMPTTDLEARSWLASKVIWYPPAGDGAIDTKALMTWIDEYMVQWPATWATLMDRVHSLSLQTAEIVRGKA